MKMLTPEALDHFHALHGEHSICFNGKFVRFNEIIAQAKLAYSIQQRAAEICKAQKDGYQVGVAGSAYNYACDHCHDAILNMEPV